MLFGTIDFEVPPGPAADTHHGQRKQKHPGSARGLGLFRLRLPGRFGIVRRFRSRRGWDRLGGHFREGQQVGLGDSVQEKHIFRFPLAVNDQIKDILSGGHNGEKLLAVLVRGIVYHRPRPGGGKGFRLGIGRFHRHLLGRVKPLPKLYAACVLHVLVTAPGIGRHGETTHQNSGAERGRQHPKFSHSDTSSTAAGFWPP